MAAVEDIHIHVHVHEEDSDLGPRLSTLEETVADQVTELTALRDQVTEFVQDLGARIDALEAAQGQFTPEAEALLTELRVASRLPVTVSATRTRTATRPRSCPRPARSPRLRVRNRFPFPRTQATLRQGGLCVGQGWPVLTGHDLSDTERGDWVRVDMSSGADGIRPG